MALTKVIDPYSNDVIDEVEIDDEKKALDKLKIAYDFYKDRSSWLSKKQRIEILKNAQKIFNSKKDEIINTSIKEGGKPYKDTLIEFNRAILGFDLAIQALFSFDGEVIPMDLTDSSKDRHAFTFLEPRGVAFGVSAFNHPINLAVHQIIPSIAAGCPIIFKPAIKTPLSPKILVESLYEAGLPEGMCQYLLTENDVTQKLVQNPQLSFLSFIGSAKVGWHLRSLLSPGAHCTLEHGGLASSIIDEGFSLENIIAGLARSAFYHAGQVCISLQRIFVHESIAKDLIDLLSEKTSSLKVGDPKDKDTDVGPLKSALDVNRIDLIVKEANVICGGKKLSPSLYAPTILLNPPLDAKISCEEIFGPVVAIYTFSDLKDAINKANNNDYVFQHSIFTNNIDRAFKAVHDLNATIVMVNDFSTFRVDWMPFYGHRLAGLGKQGIGYAIKELSIEKLVVMKYGDNYGY